MCLSVRLKGVQVEEQIIEMDQNSKAVKVHCLLIKKTRHSLSELVEKHWQETRNKEAFSYEKLVYIALQSAEQLKELHSLNLYLYRSLRGCAIDVGDLYEVTIAYDVHKLTMVQEVLEAINQPEEVENEYRRAYELLTTEYAFKVIKNDLSTFPTEPLKAKPTIKSLAEIELKDRLYFATLFEDCLKRFEKL